MQSRTIRLEDEEEKAETLHHGLAADLVCVSPIPSHGAQCMSLSQTFFHNTLNMETPSLTLFSSRSLGFEYFMSRTIINCTWEPNDRIARLPEEFSLSYIMLDVGVLEFMATLPPKEGDISVENFARSKVLLRAYNLTKEAQSVQGKLHTPWHPPG
jgi:hypothetical protein